MIPDSSTRIGLHRMSQIIRIQRNERVHSEIHYRHVGTLDFSRVSTSRFDPTPSQRTSSSPLWSGEILAPRQSVRVRFDGNLGRFTEGRLARRE